MAIGKKRTRHPREISIKSSTVLVLTEPAPGVRASVLSSGSKSAQACLPAILAVLVLFLLFPIGSAATTHIAASSHTVALKSDGSLWAWGYNSDGQLGDGSKVNSLMPKQIGTGFAAVAAGGGGWHTIALKSDGSLWAWGDNGRGQLGDGSTTDSQVPKQIDTGYAAIAAGQLHTVALKSDGSLWAWGYNGGGQLGDGTTVNSLVPKQIGTGYAAVAAGGFHTVALKLDGSLWAWGDNGYGQLGDGTTVDSLVPKQISTGFAAVAAGVEHTVALKLDGSLWAWGRNNSSQIGDDTISAAILVPKQIGTGYAAIAAGWEHTVALKSDGSLWTWGDNGWGGQLGDGTTVNSRVPKQIGTGYAAIAAGRIHTVALKSDGSLWAWGSNAAGQLGDGSTTDSLLPKQIGTGYGGDDIAPAVPTGLTAVPIGATQMSLSWMASTDNAGVTWYKVYRNGALIGSAGTTSYGDSGLTASSAYIYTVAACDVAGNCSAQSVAVAITTGASDIATPSAIVANISTNQPNYTVDSGEVLKLSGNILAGSYAGQVADVYIQAQLNAGPPVYFLGPTQQWTTAVAPIAAGFPIADVSAPDFYQTPVVTGLPPGNYQFSMIVAPAGNDPATSDNRLGYGSTTTKVHPAPVAEETISAFLSAKTGGTIALASGSSVTIPPGALAGDQVVTLSLLSSLPKQPPGGLMTGVGRSLSLAFSTQQPFAGTSQTQGIQFTLNHGATPPARLSGSMPVVDIVDDDNFAALVPIPCDSSSTCSVVPISAIQSFPVTPSIHVGAVNTVTDGMPLPQLGNKTWTGDRWSDGVYQIDPNKKYLVLVHGILSATEKAFPDSKTVEGIRRAGGYDAVLGFNYEFYKGVDDGGAALSRFLTTLKSAGLQKVDIEAHSMGGAVTLSAICRNDDIKIGNVVMLGSPVTGTPAATAGTIEQANLGLVGLVNPLGTLVLNLQSLYQQPTLQTAQQLLTGQYAPDLQRGSDILRYNNGCVASKLNRADSTLGATNLVCVAGDVFTASPAMRATGTYLKSWFGGEGFDGVIPKSSAMCEGAGFNPARVTAMVFPLSHTELQADLEVIATVGAVVNPAAPPACTTYSYSAWSACQSNNTQTRTETSRSPTGCAGTPVLSQACTYTPPTPEVTLTGSFTYTCSVAESFRGTPLYFTVTIQGTATGRERTSTYSGTQLEIPSMDRDFGDSYNCGSWKDLAPYRGCRRESGQPATTSFTVRFTASAASLSTPEPATYYGMVLGYPRYEFPGRISCP